MRASGTVVDGGAASGDGSGDAFGVGGGVVGPLVLLDGRPWSGAWVRRVRAEGPVDRREAELVLRRGSGASGVAAERERLRALTGRRVTVAAPLAIGGGESRLMVLLDGRLDTTGQRLDERHDELTLTARCGWSALLSQRVRRGDLEGAMRSRWTIEQVIDRLNRLLGLDLDVDLLDPRMRGAALEPGVLAASEAGPLLVAICRRHGLIVRRTLSWAGRGVRERRELRRASHAPGLSLRRGQVVVAGGVEALTATVAEPPPTRLVAEAAGEVVESTFNLLPGWGDEDLDLSAEAYGKSTSADFDAVANAFRLWVLNEDGAFAGEPFNAAALFDESRPTAGPLESTLRFGPALTQDSAGRSVGTVVEISTDGGQTWMRPGAVRVLTDRAGVYLDDAALGEAWLDAVRAGAGRVRVTATLRNPLPTVAERWRGNAFAGAFAERHDRLGTLFVRRRVAETSRYHDAVRSGGRKADEADDRPAMADWLVEQAGRLGNGVDRVRLRTTGLVLGVGAGDRITRIGSEPIAISGHSGTVEGGGLAVAAIEHRWDRRRSELTLAV